MSRDGSTSYLFRPIDNRTASVRGQYHIRWMIEMQEVYLLYKVANRSSLTCTVISIRSWIRSAILGIGNPLTKATPRGT